MRLLCRLFILFSYKHDLAVTSARFSSISGNKIVSVCNDNYIRIWEKVSEQGLSDKNIKKIRHRYVDLIY